MRRACFLAIALLALQNPAVSLAQPEGAPCLVEPTDQMVGYGQVVTCSIDPIGDSDVFRFMAVGNERVVIQVATQTAFREPCIRLFSPTNVQLWNLCTGAGFQRVLATLNEPGLHTIQVFEDGNDETMNYTLVVERLLPASPAARPIGFGESLTDAIDPLGEIDVFTFAAEAGANIELRVAALVGFREPCVELIHPDSNRTVGCTGGGTSAIMMTLPLTGDYTAFVHENGQDETTGYSLTLTCITGPCPTEAITLAVPANAMWIDTGVDLADGQEVGTRANGFWRASPAQPLFGPMGLPQPCDPQSAGCPIHANHGALIAKVGAGPAFVVGEAFAFFAPSAGRLFLMINDDVNALNDNSGSVTVHVLYSSPPLGVDPSGDRGPTGLLGSPAPNPFVESTQIRFRLAEPSAVTLRIYDMAGRRVRELHNAARLDVGVHTVRWDGQGEDGRRAPAGVYFYRLEIAGRGQTRQVILLE